MPGPHETDATRARRTDLLARVIALLLVSPMAAFGAVVLASWLGAPAWLSGVAALACVGAMAYPLFRGGRDREASADATIPSAAGDVPAGPREATMGDTPLVGIVMGSQSDMAVMEECAKTLESFGVPYELLVASAHRQPAKVHEWASGAADRGIRVIVAAAGKAAHLGGVVAAYTTLPVIAVPMKTSDLGGLDSLLSMVQMPSGVPVACVAIDGAKNAAILATQVLATSMPEYRDAIARMKAELAEG